MTETIHAVSKNGVEDESVSSASAGATREQLQIVKLREANSKYKSLLKKAKGRIQAQEEELEELQSTISSIEEGNKSPNTIDSAGNKISSSKPKLDSNGMIIDESDSLVRICQRIRLDNEDPLSGGQEEIYALVEYESTPNNNLHGESTQIASTDGKYKKWISFTSESALVDFIRRDTGEPLVLPPYSLTPAQSAKVENESSQAVAHITEEFRRFRVRAEVARKQADATVKAIHSNNVETTRSKIEGQDLENELQQARTDHAQLAALQREIAEQEAHWKAAYDTLRTENKALKSSGAEALLAAQWRQRYEMCLSEKEELDSSLEIVQSQLDMFGKKNKVTDAGRFEIKYRDLKESFRLYRKKAKEIFEAQQKGHTSAFSGADDAKLIYLRNLMVNYLSSDPEVREHMEGAICTVLRFSDDEKTKIEKKKEDHIIEPWFTSGLRGYKPSVFRGYKPSVFKGYKRVIRI